jgi:hypothetical protein
MTYGIVEVDHEAGSGGNLFAGQTDPGANGTVRLAAKDSRSTRVIQSDPSGAANPRLRMACLRDGR